VQSHHRRERRAVGSCGDFLGAKADTSFATSAAERTRHERLHFRRCGYGAQDASEDPKRNPDRNGMLSVIFAEKARLMV